MGSAFGPHRLLIRSSSRSPHQRPLHPRQPIRRHVHRLLAIENILSGGAGGDNLNGGIGKGTADYSASSAGVSVDLAGNVVSGGDAEGDTLSWIESLTQAATTQRYAHLDADPLRRASDTIGNTIAAALGDVGREEEIVDPLKKR